MKKNTRKLSAGLILTVYFLIAASCSGNSKESASTKKNQEVSVIEVSIGGMSCTGCEQTIRNNVGKLEGIKTVKASYTSGIAMVEYFEGIVDTTLIRQTITRSGYTVNKFFARANEEGEK